MVGEGGWIVIRISRAAPPAPEPEGGFGDAPRRAATTPARISHPPPAATASVAESRGRETEGWGEGGGSSYGIGLVPTSGPTKIISLLGGLSPFGTSGSPRDPPPFDPSLLESELPRPQTSLTVVLLRRERVHRAVADGLGHPLTSDTLAGASWMRFFGRTGAALRVRPNSTRGPSLRIASTRFLAIQEDGMLACGSRTTDSAALIWPLAAKKIRWTGTPPLRRFGGQAHRTGGFCLSQHPRSSKSPFKCTTSFYPESWSSIQSEGSCFRHTVPTAALCSVLRKIVAICSDSRLLRTTELPSSCGSHLSSYWAQLPL